MSDPTAPTIVKVECHATNGRHADIILETYPDGMTVLDVDDGPRFRGRVELTRAEREALSAALSPAAEAIVAAAREWHAAHAALDAFLDADAMQPDDDYAAGIDRWQRANAGLHAAVGALGGSDRGEGSGASNGE